jgi:hypothetical protein
VIQGEGSNFSAVVADANRQIAKLGAGAQRSGKQMVTSVQAASGTIRLLEGDITRNVRAVEKFVTMIPGVGAALKIAFPLVGALALAGVLERLGEEVTAVLKKMHDAPDKIREGFEEMRLSAQTANDELRKNNDELANQIAKLEGKPQNNLAVALDEARLHADKLQESLARSYQEAKRLLEENQTSLWAQVLLGKGATGDVKGNIENFYKRISEAAANYNAATHAGDQVGAAAAQNELEKLQQNALAYAATEISKRQGAAVRPNIVEGKMIQSRTAPYAEIYGNQDANIAMLQGMRNLIYQDQDSAQLARQNKPLVEREQQLQHTRELQAEEKRAATERMEQAQKELDRQQSEHEMTLDEVAAYWRKLADTAKAGSVLYSDALDKANRAKAEALKKFNEQTAEGLLHDAEHTRGTQNDIHDAITEEWLRNRDLGDAGDRTRQEDAVRAFRETAQRMKELEEEQEEQIKLQMQAGSLSPHGGAAQLQTLHRERYAEWLDNAKALSSQFPYAGGVVPEASQTDASRIVQAEQDAALVRSTSALGAFSISLGKLSQEFTNTGEQLSSVFVEGLRTFNQTLIEVLSTPANMMRGKHVWGNAGASFLKSAGGMALQHTEGVGMELLGKIPGPIGKFFQGAHKPTGSAGDPIYVRSADGAARAAVLNMGAGGVAGAFGASSASGGVGGSLINMGAGAAASGIAAWIAGMRTAGAVSSFGAGGVGAFADGGSIPSNLPALVGERGPEIFMPRTAGTIIPNHKIGGGGDRELHIHINGNPDPAAMRMVAHRVFAGYLPQVGKLVEAHNADNRRRRPASQG